MLVAAKLQPHRIRTFTFSPDPDFEAKLLDIVGLYLNPPENALVLCVDEKPGIQALDRRSPYCHSARRSPAPGPTNTSVTARRRCWPLWRSLFRQARAGHNPASRLSDRDSPGTKLKLVKGSRMPPRSSSDGEASSLPHETPSSVLQTLWVEVGCRHAQTLVSEKEHHEYGEDSKPAL